MHQRSWAKQTIISPALMQAAKDADITLLGAEAGREIIVSTIAAPEHHTEHPWGAILTMGAYSYCHGFNDYISACTVTIGRYCSIAVKSRRMGTKHPTDWVTTHPFPFYKERFQAEGYHKLYYDSMGGCVSIGNDVWIGEDVIVSENLSIGDGAIIGAGAIVTKDVPPYTIVGGIPASVIRKRFPDRLIERMLASSWWQYDFKDFPGELMNQPEAFLEFIEGACLAPMPRKVLSLDELL